ncbi:MAG: LamG-like jellyroll fold domain-containing protein, partial [Verrucomicrobiota bacterium]
MTIRQIFLILLYPVAAGAATINPSDYLFRQKITFTNFPIGVTLTNFPVLVKFDAGDTNLYAFMASPTGDDLRFTDATGTNLIHHEIEGWNAGGESPVWVQVPVFTNPQCVFAVWGNPTNTLPASATNGAVWSEGFRLVQHMNDTAGAAVGDASPDQRTSDVIGTFSWQAPGRIGPALRLFGNANDRIDLGLDDNISLNGTPYTISAWFQNLQPNSQWRTLTRGNGLGHQIIVQLSAINLGMFHEVDGFRDSGADLNPPHSSWHHIAGVGTGTITRLYVDGVEVGVCDRKSNSDIRWIGNFSGGQKFAEYLDEFRVATVSRSPEWIRATWMNAVSNDVFNTMDPAEATETNRPVIATLPPSNITSNSATLNGLLGSTGNSATTVHVFYGTTDAGTNQAAWDNQLLVNVSGLVLATNLNGLTPDTCTFYRYYATNASGDAWALSSESFITPAPPRVDNEPGAGNIGVGTATLNGRVISKNAGDVTLFWGNTDGGTNASSWMANQFLGSLANAGFS